MYISLRPHAGIKDGGCMAASGDDASIIRCNGVGMIW